MIDNSFKRYFTFWFSTLANGGEPLSVKLEDRDFYILTKEAALSHGKVDQSNTVALSRIIETIYTNLGIL